MFVCSFVAYIVGHTYMPIFTVFGFDGCGYYTAALHKLKDHKKHVDTKVHVAEYMYKRQDWPAFIAQVHASATNSRLKAHTTSPLIFVDDRYVGGHDDLIALLTRTSAS